MVKKGVGLLQLDKAKESKEAILKVLNDGEWHRYNEIVKKTKLSTATVSKHLKELDKTLLEKKVDLDAGEYPYPVLYRWKPNLPLIDKTSLDKINRHITDYAKAPRLYLNFMNQSTGLFVLEAIETYLTVGGPDELFVQYMENHIVAVYREYMTLLVNSIKDSVKKGNRIELFKILKEDKNKYIETELTGTLREIILEENKPTFAENLKAFFYVRHPKATPEKV